MTDGTSITKQETKRGPQSEEAGRNPTSQTVTEGVLEGKLQARSDQQALLVEVNAILAGAIDAEIVLGQILSRLAERAWLAHASVYLLQPEARLLRCAAEIGYPTKDEYRVLTLDGPGVVAWVGRMAESLYVPDVTREPRYLCSDARIKSEYVVPLVSGSKVLGVLDIESDQTDGIRAATRKLVDQIAAQAALAIERGGLYKKLRASEEFFRSIFEQNHFGVVLGDLDGRLTKVNPAFAQLLGYELDELQGKHFAEITYPEDRQENLILFQELLEGKIARFTLEKRFLRKSGEPAWCNVTGSLIRGSEGEPAHFLVTVEDLNERKKAEEERAQLQKQLVQAQKMEAIGTLAGGLAHDFNNFLGVILGFASLLRFRLSPDNPLQEPVQMIERSAEEAAGLTRELLGLARHEEVRRTPVSTGKILERVEKIVTRTFDRRIQIETWVSSKPPWIVGDPTQLEQALLNLCINARDAMPGGGKLAMEVSTKTLDPDDPLRPAQCAPGEYVQIGVKDTGTGMDPQVIQHIFDPFFTTKGPGQGSGLGLAMVYVIIRAHGGFLHVESEVGRGSQFTIYLPAVEQPQEIPVLKEPLHLEQGSGTVLVVDDEPLVLAFAEQGLAKLGYQVLTAESGRRACEIYASPERKIDCVLLDVVMPDMSGLETYQKLREIDPQVRVILSSGYSDRRVAREARGLGATDFLDKPYTLEALSLAIKRAQRN